jgi:hypothetical protein
MPCTNRRSPPPAHHPFRPAASIEPVEPDTFEGLGSGWRADTRCGKVGSWTRGWHLARKLNRNRPISPLNPLKGYYVRAAKRYLDELGIDTSDWN